MILTHTSWGWRHWRGGMCRMPICVASQLSVLAMQKDLALDWLDIYPMIVIVPSIYTVIYWIDIYIYPWLVGYIIWYIYIYTVLYTMTLWYPLESYSTMIRYARSVFFSQLLGRKSARGVCPWVGQVPILPRCWLTWLTVPFLLAESPSVSWLPISLLVRCQLLVGKIQFVDSCCWWHNIVHCRFQ
jgi:hypothetical protein